MAHEPHPATDAQLDLGTLRTLVAVIGQGLASTRPDAPLPDRLGLVLDHLPAAAVRLAGDAANLLLSAVMTARPDRAPGRIWRTDYDALTLDRVAELGQALTAAFVTTAETATLPERVLAAVETLPTQTIGELGGAASQLIGLAEARLDEGMDEGSAPACRDG